MVFICNCAALTISFEEAIERYFVSMLPVYTKAYLYKLHPVYHC